MAELVNTKESKTAQPRQSEAKGEKSEAPAGYVYVTRSQPNAATPDDEDRPAGYVQINGQDERRLVDKKSVLELGVLGYRVVD
jgi:hypothetical protein